MKSETTVFVLHHTNSGTPESGEIHSIYTSRIAALAAMEQALEELYDGVSAQENEDEDFIYMYISEQVLCSFLSF